MMVSTTFFYSSEKSIVQNPELHPIRPTNASASYRTNPTLCR